MRYYHLVSLAAFAGLAIAAAPAPSLAQSASGVEAVSKRVYYRDLNLAEEAGAKALLLRIRHAAKDVCGPPERGDPLGRGRLYAACVDDTVGKAVATLGDPTVARLADPRSARNQLAAIGR